MGSGPVFDCMNRRWDHVLGECSPTCGSIFPCCIKNISLLMTFGHLASFCFARGPDGETSRGTTLKCTFRALGGPARIGAPPLLRTAAASDGGGNDVAEEDLLVELHRKCRRPMKMAMPSALARRLCLVPEQFRMAPAALQGPIWMECWRFTCQLWGMLRGDSVHDTAQVSRAR
jgi:hypothetical protein